MARRRFSIAQKIRPLEPIEWPDGSEQPVKNITWEEQEILADVGDGKLTMREAMPLLMPALLPGKTWDQIKRVLDAQTMEAIVEYAAGNMRAAEQELEGVMGNAEGAAPESPPSTPPPTSSPALPEATAALSGT